jgi:integrase
VDERRVQEFIAALNQTTLAPKSIRNIVGVLKQTLGKGRWRDWRLVLPEVPQKEQRFFTPEEMRLIINAPKGQWRVIFAMLACTGLRCGEVCGLHVEDLNLGACQITVKRGIWRGMEISTKSKRSYRLVDIEPALAEMLREHLNGRKTGRVFATRLGTPFSKDNLRRKLRDIVCNLDSSRRDSMLSGIGMFNPSREQGAGRLDKSVGRPFEPSHNVKIHALWTQL